MAQRAQTIPLTASAAIIGRTMVKMSGSLTVAPCTAATDSPIGVADFDTPIGGICSVIVSGVAKVRAGAAIAPQTNGRVTSDALGRVVPAVPGVGVNNGILGFALEAAAALGEEIDILIEPSVFQG